MKVNVRKSVLNDRLLHKLLGDPLKIKTYEE